LVLLSSMGALALQVNQMPMPNHSQIQLHMQPQPQMPMQQIDRRFDMEIQLLNNNITDLTAMWAAAHWYNYNQFMFLGNNIIRDRHPTLKNSMGTNTLAFTYLSAGRTQTGFAMDDAIGLIIRCCQGEIKKHLDKARADYERTIMVVQQEQQQNMMRAQL